MKKVPKNTDPTNQAAAKSPYIGDIGQPLTTIRDKAVVGMPLLLFALVLGLITGILVCGLLAASNALVSLVWDVGRTAADVLWYPVAVCGVGGLICGLWTKFVYEPPASLEEVLATVKRTGEYQVASLPKATVSFLLPLAFGGSVGPEAGLTGIIAALCTKIGSSLARAGLLVKSATDLTISSALTAVFGSPFLGALACTENTLPGGSPNSDDAPSSPGDAPSSAGDSPNSADSAAFAGSLNSTNSPSSPADAPSSGGSPTYRRPVKIVLYTAAAFGAFAGMQLVSTLPFISGGLPRFEGINAQGAEFLWFIPCVLAGWGLALLYAAAEHGASALRERFKRFTVALPALCGVVIGCVALIFPDVLFSGEEQLRELASAWETGGIASVENAVAATSLLNASGAVTGGATASGALATEAITSGAAASSALTNDALTIGAVILLFGGILKAVATPLCLNCGWRGGHFFPMICAGVSVGLGIAAFCGADAMLCATVLTSALMGAILRKPLLAGALLLLCFPASGILWMALAALIGSALPLPSFGPRANMRASNREKAY